VTLFSGTTYYVLAQQFGATPPPASDAAVQLRVGYVGPAAADADGDGVANGSDCAPGDPTAWAVPGPARDLRFTTRSAMTWLSPQVAGSDAPLYDLLRSNSPQDFTKPACVASDLDVPGADDATAAAGLCAYLVRVRNACGANSGSSSAGMPGRRARALDRSATDVVEKVEGGRVRVRTPPDPRTGLVENGNI
jgi:hypothetical protein